MENIENKRIRIYLSHLGVRGVLTINCPFPILCVPDGTTSHKSMAPPPLHTIGHVK